MGGAAKGTGKLLDEGGKIITGGDSTHYQDQGAKADKHLGDEWDRETQGGNPIGALLDNTYGKLDRYVTGQLWGGGGPDDPDTVEQRDTSAFAQVDLREHTLSSNSVQARRREDD